MNIQSVSTQLLYTTVPITIKRKDGTQSRGTGFLYSLPSRENSSLTIPLLVTNYHVVRDAEQGIAEFNVAADGTPKLGDRSRIGLPNNFFDTICNPDLDIAAAPVASIFQQLNDANRLPFYRTIDPKMIPTDEQLSKLGAIEDVTFIGYPSSLQDSHNVTPLARRGITATPIWNDFDGKPRFLIDAGVFPGSSGSPVFILNEGAYAYGDGLIMGKRLLFLGMLSEALTRPEKTSNIYLGIGAVLKSSTIHNFLRTRLDDLFPQTSIQELSEMEDLDRELSLDVLAQYLLKKFPNSTMSSSKGLSDSMSLARRFGMTKLSDIDIAFKQTKAARDAMQPERPTRFADFQLNRAVAFLHPEHKVDTNFAMLIAKYSDLVQKP